MEQHQQKIRQEVRQKAAGHVDGASVYTSGQVGEQSCNGQCKEAVRFYLT